MKIQKPSGGAAWLYHRLPWWQRFRLMVEKELHSKLPLPFQQRLAMYLKGFLGESYVLYQLDTNRSEQYVSDYARFVKTPHINGRYSILLNDKLLFYKHLQPFREHLPLHYGVIHNGEYLNFMDGENAFSEVLNLCQNKKCILKRMYGGAGVGLYVLESASSKFILNGAVIGESELKSLMKKMRRYLVMEHIRQHDYAAAVYPETTNTLRVLTLWDYDEGKPFIARAVHRFGADRSRPVDNWTQGGFAAPVDVESGILGKATTFPTTNRLEWFTEHPTTKKAIAGLQLPFWDEIRRKIIEIAEYVFYLPYVGWDIVIKDDGFAILEGNNFTDVNVFQVHRPLLEDPRIYRFYKTHRIVK